MRTPLLLALLTLVIPLSRADEITVSAAASLTNAFQEIAEAFEQVSPGHSVRLNFAGSGVLLQQLASGAPVDILATADQFTMDQAEGRNLVTSASRRNFASNTLVLITPSAGHAVQRLDALRGPGYERVAVSNPLTVPAGRYSRDALAALQLWLPMQDRIIRTQNVRQTLDYVARNEVDAGFVYSTDAALMADKVSVQLTVPTTEPILYPVAITREGARKPASALFVAFLLGQSGQDVLVRHGFGRAE